MTRNNANLREFSRREHPPVMWHHGPPLQGFHPRYSNGYGEKKLLRKNVKGSQNYINLKRGDPLQTEGKTSDKNNTLCGMQEVVLRTFEKRIIA